MVSSILMLLLVGAGLAPRVRADQVVMSDANYPGARIVGMERGQLRFRSADGGLHNVWLDEVELILVDRHGLFDDFNQAERFRGEGQAARAVLRYRRAHRLAEDFWVDLIAARMLLACDAAEQLDNAVLNFIRVAQGTHAGLPAAARLLPEAIPPERTKRAQRAIEQLHAAESKDSEKGHQALFQLLRFEILRRTGDARAELLAPHAGDLAIPAEARTPEVYAIVLHALRAWLRGEITAPGLAALDRALGTCPEGAMPGLLLLKGETLQRTAATRDQMLRAAWPLMRVAIHFPDSPEAPEGLYGTARILARIGRADKAADLLAECIAHESVSEETRAAAMAARADLPPEAGP
jgi:hypothetical protein